MHSPSCGYLPAAPVYLLRWRGLGSSPPCTPSSPSLLPRPPLPTLSQRSAVAGSEQKEIGLSFCSADGKCFEDSLKHLQGLNIDVMRRGLELFKKEFFKKVKEV